MRKAITILLVLLMVLSLAACGGGVTEKAATASESIADAVTPSTNSTNKNSSDLNAVKEAIVGLWLVNDDGLYKGYIFRDDGSVYYKAQLGSTGITQEFNATYKVLENGIELTNEAGDTKTLTYSYSNGTLKMFDGDAELFFDEG